VQEVLHHVALALTVLGLAQAALRVAATVTPLGLERAITALVLGVATAVAEALGLGLVGLGARPVALIFVTAMIWAATLLWLPSPAISPMTELAKWWGRLDGPWRVCAAALCGAFVAWVAWQLRFPSIGLDSADYHYPQVAGWIANGRPGSILSLNYDIPYGNFPLTDEVAQTWGAAIARSWIPLALWTPVMVVALAAAALGVAALVTLPLVVRQLNEPQTDLPALTWLASAAALALAAGRRPALLVPAVVATGLAVGTKPSTAPMAVAALAVGTYLARERLRPLAGWLALGLAAAFAIGGVWYARNLVQHGWPLWPHTEAPWGDPSPRFLALLDVRFLERPAATLEGRVGDYVTRLSGGLLLLAGAVLALLSGALGTRLERGVRRALVVSGALALIALLVWSLAWGTGLSRADLAGVAGWPLTTTRYMLPAIGAAMVAVALTARVPGTIGHAATVLLAGALAWNVVADARLGAPYTPPVGVVVLGALGGALALGVAILGRPSLVRLTRRARPLPAGAAGILAAVGLGVLLAPVSNGFIERYTEVSRSTAPGADVVSWFLTQPGFETGDETIAFAARAAFGQLAGDHFTHRLELIPRRARCREVARSASRNPVLIVDQAWFHGILGVLPYTAGRCLAGRRAAYERGAYFVYRPEEPGYTGGPSTSAMTTARAE
jgi:hypothetical protein